jgi:hypothetical protein
MKGAEEAEHGLMYGGCSRRHVRCKVFHLLMGELPYLALVVDQEFDDVLVPLNEQDFVFGKRKPTMSRAKYLIQHATYQRRGCSIRVEAWNG